MTLDSDISPLLDSTTEHPLSSSSTDQPGNFDNNPISTKRTRSGRNEIVQRSSSQSWMSLTLWFLIDSILSKQYSSTVWIPNLEPGASNVNYVGIDKISQCLEDGNFSKKPAASEECRVNSRRNFLPSSIIILYLKSVTDLLKLAT